MSDGGGQDRFRPGNTPAFERLVLEYQAGLLRYATRLLGCPDAAQDAVQETFLRLLRERQETLRVSHWLLKVCRNLCTDRQRKEARMQRRHTQVAVPEVEREEVGEVEAREDRESVGALLQELPEGEREVLLLKVCDGRSYREIAELTGLSLHHVGSAVHRGLRRLAIGLRGCGLA